MGSTAAVARAANPVSAATAPMAKVSRPITPFEFLRSGIDEWKEKALVMDKLVMRCDASKECFAPQKMLKTCPKADSEGGATETETNGLALSGWS